jgi:hypothetical protein
MIFLNMDYFLHAPRGKKWEKNYKIIFRVFWCGIMNIHNKKLIHDA